MGHTSDYTVKEKLKSPRAWVLRKPASAFAPSHIWSNEDMEPVPPALQTWTLLTFCAYWFSDLVNAGSWSMVSGFVELGLTWWQSILAVFTGAFILSIVVSLNGIIGARLHTPFAITSRASFGTNFYCFPVISRMVIAWFWMAINTFQGGTGITQMLIAIWPSYRNLPNHLPESSGVTSQAMLSFFLFWLLQFPFCLIHPRRLRPLFLAKGIILPIVALGMMAWSIHRAGPLKSEVLRASSKLSGTAMYYAFFSAVTSCMGSWSTLCCNIGDFSRYSKKETNAMLQICIVPFFFTITSLFGAICSNMTLAIYGKVLWQPFDVIDQWHDTSKGRAAAFFCALAWVLGNIGTNVTANSISAANDLTTLFPKWVNILRGQMFAVFVGCWAFAPWKVLSSAGNFIGFMSAYSVVLAPIATILTADYWIVKRQKYVVPELYLPDGIYSYWHGFNWRSLVALLVALGPNMPGFINTINSNVQIGGAKYVFAIADIFGFVVAALVYSVLSKVFPDHKSLVAQQILAQDVIEGRVPGYENFNGSRSTGSPKPASLEEEEKNDYDARVDPVTA